jgi:hypothetical protein
VRRRRWLRRERGDAHRHADRDGRAERYRNAGSDGYPATPADSELCCDGDADTVADLQRDAVRDE